MAGLCAEMAEDHAELAEAFPGHARKHVDMAERCAGTANSLADMARAFMAMAKEYAGRTGGDAPRLSARLEEQLREVLDGLDDE